VNVIDFNDFKGGRIVKSNVLKSMIALALALLMALPMGLAVSGNESGIDNGIADSPGYNFEHTAIASLGDSIYQVWVDGPLHDARLMFSMNSAPGAKWTQPVTLTGSDFNPLDVQMVAGNQKLHVVWMDGLSKLLRTGYLSIDLNGQPSRPTVFQGENSHLAVDSDSVALSTVSYGKMEVRLSHNSGASFESYGLFNGMSCMANQLSYSNGNLEAIAFAGFKTPADGTLNSGGLYYTSFAFESWFMPNIITLTGSVSDLTFENGILAWSENTEFKMNKFQMREKSPGIFSEKTLVSSADQPKIIPAPQPAQSRLPPKKWTFMCYLDGDNNLDTFAFEDINEMEMVGSNADINILVLFDRNTASDTKCYYVNYDANAATIASTEIPLSSINASWGTELNMGNPQTAIDFGKYVFANYPAQKYAWDFWNHGGSWNWLQCSDDNSGGDMLTALETRSIYETLRTATGRRALWDVVTFDECIVADNEVVYDVKQYANYTVFSEDSIAGPGYDYTGVLNHIKTNPNMGGEEFSAWVCTEYYADYPTGTALSTLSSINNTAYDYDLMEAIENFGQKMRHKASTLNTQIKSAADAAIDWQSITYQPDLRHFAQLITTGINNATDSQINAAAWRIIKLTAANAATDTYNSPTWQHNRPILIHDANTNANGLTIYANQAYDTTFNTLKLATQSNWGKFVQNVWGTPANVVNVEPTVAITSPSEGAYVVYNTVTTISGTAADSDGTVQRVQVKIDRENWQNATGTTSWSYSWNLAGWAPGPHRIQARSYDGTDYSMAWMDRNVTEIVDPNLADLTLWPNQITFSNPTPNEGDTVTIGATIHNVGTVNDAANVQVGFYVGDPAAGGSLIGTYVTTTPSTILHNNGTGTASTTWNTAGWAGSRDIYVVADPGYLISELTDANNTKFKTIPVSGYAVDLTCTANTSTVQAGASHNYAVTVKNTGTLTDTIRLTIDNPTTWTANFNNNPQGKSTIVPPVERLVSGYHTYAEVQAELAAIEAAHPAIAKRYKLATTAEGRNITVLKISDNVTTNESEPGSLIIGNHHAREWMTVEIPLYYANYLVNNYGADPQATWLVDNREIFIIPNLNPDGLQYSQFTDSMWRKNRRNNGDGTYGVDLNRNYNGSQDGNPTGAWGVTGTSHTTSDETYCGPSAFSEPETRAVRDLMLARPNLALSISFHSYAEEIYWPWGYSTGVQTPDDAAQQSIANDFAAINGYAAMQSAALYATSGDTDDWAYGYFEYRTSRTFFPFTVETNSAFQPAASEITPTCQLNLGLCIEGAKRAGDLLKTAPTITHTALPNTINTATSYNVVASFASPAGVDTSSLQMFWKTSGSYTQVAMTPTGTPGQYQASIPAQTDGTWVNYYVRGASTPGTVSTNPDYAPNSRHSFFVGNDVVVYNVTLAPGASKIVNLTVIAPAGALPNEQAKIDVIGTSIGNAAKSDSVETVTTVSPAILLVNDGNTVIAQYQTALTNGGYAYDDGTPASDLSKYRIVIWATDGSATLAAAEKTALMNFMDAGGSVYINGEDIGYDIATEDDTAIGLGTSPNNFYGLYLHATYLADSSGGTLMNGVTGDPITNGMSNYDISGSYPDAIGLADGTASTIFRYNDATTRAGALKAETTDYKLVYISCEYFEGTTDLQANKNLLMQRIIDWLNPDRVPTVSVTAPTATNTIASGSYTIRWTASDDNPFPTMPIDIDYSANGGSTWNPVVANIANTGSYVWDTTTRVDGVNYLVRVTATDSIGQATTDISDNPFSIDNTVNDQWQLQVQTSVAGFKDLDMKPVELIDNTYYSNITAVGQFLLGNQRFLSGALATSANVQGSWTFDVWGRVTAAAANGRLYAKVYSYDGITTTQLFQTTNDDETVGSFTSFHEFSWTFTAPSASVPAGQRVCVEIWLDATAGSGNSNVQNLANRDIRVAGTLTGTYANTLTQDDAYEAVTEVSGWSSSNVMTQNFDNGGTLPTGWTLTTTGSAWAMTNDNARYGAIVGAPTTDYGAVCDSDLAGSGVTVNSWIKSPVFDCTGYTVVTLKFSHRYDWYGEANPEGIYVYVANDGAVTAADTQVYYSVGADIALTTLNINITAVAGNRNQIQIGWNYRANYDYWWIMDDVEVIGNRSTSSLEHKWTTTVPAGKSPYNFRVDAYRTTSTDTDNFVFAYSTDNVTFTDMVTVTATTDSDTYLSYTLPTTLSGTVYIRVRDSDRTAGRTILDIIRIDHMFIESVEGPPQMIIAYDYGSHQSYVRPVLSTATIVFNIPVLSTPGWNFVSFPLAVSGAPNVILNDLAGDGTTTWDVVKWYDPTDPADPWKTYRLGSSSNDLIMVNNCRGMWVHVTNGGLDNFITVEGTAPSSTVIQLYRGWNLVGYPSATPRLASATLPAQADMVSVFQVAAPYISDTSNLASVTMTQGKGYWVHVTADCTWTVSY
jgi:carboxypeptidase T